MKKQNRTGRLLINTISSFAMQIVTIACGFVLPRVIIAAYGSEVNGLVNSIGQFLHVISFLELGIGAVVQASLYKPLAEKDNRTMSEVLVSANRFFRKLGIILLIYVLILMVIYPHFFGQEFGHVYTAILIASVSISAFAQYYFGIVNGLLLNADQKGYIQYIAAIVSLVLTTIVCCIEAKIGCSIHIVKLSASLIYLIRPFVMKFYVDKHYEINWRIKYDIEPIKQKWNGIAQHLSAVILDGTDTIVLTVFSTFINVSIYSVYNLITYGIKNLFLSVANGGIQSLVGDMWAKKEIEKLKDFYNWMEWAIHTATTFLFTCTGILIVPFVSVYTKGVNDADYNQPLFALLIVAANGCHCLRLPYHIISKATGKFKETQNSYFISTILNILISILMVYKFGLVGVAIGTLISMLYQTIWMAWFTSKKLSLGSFGKFFKQLFVDVLSSFCCVILCSIFHMKDVNYFEWTKLAFLVVVITILVIGFINIIVYRKMMLRLFQYFIKRKMKK